MTPLVPHVPLNDDRRPVLVVFGTRPEAIKMAPVVKALQASRALRPVVCVTEQHQEMLAQVLTFFGLEPEVRLGVMAPGQSPSQVAARILERLPAVFQAVAPAAVLVQGDTTTTLAAALAAFHDRIPVGHVEAGLRTYRLDSPFPEEMNRQVVTRLARWHFPPTAWAAANLEREGVAASAVHVVGNPVIDALEWAVGHLGAHRNSVLPGLETGGRKLVLVTAHRRESFGEPFEALCAGLRSVVERNPEVELVYPVHLNPAVQEPVRRELGGVARVHLIAPLAYWELVDLLRRSYLVVTDSGGIQEEAPTLGKPVVVLRETTERPEGVAAGTAVLVGTGTAGIVGAVEKLLRDPEVYRRMATTHNPYGDGHTAERIVAVLEGSLVPGLVGKGT